MENWTTSDAMAWKSSTFNMLGLQVTLIVFRFSTDLEEGSQRKQRVKHRTLFNSTLH